MKVAQTTSQDTAVPLFADLFLEPPGGENVLIAHVECVVSNVVGQKKVSTYYAVQKAVKSEATARDGGTGIAEEGGGGSAIRQDGGNSIDDAGEATTVTTTELHSVADHNIKQLSFNVNRDGVKAAVNAQRSGGKETTGDVDV